MSTILIYVFLIVFFLVYQAAKKKDPNSQKKQTGPRPAPQTRQQPDRNPVPQQSGPHRHREHRAAPVHDHDHPGSLGDLHDEGFDPCHDEQLQPASDPALTVPHEANPVQADLSFSWTKDEIVKGFVMGEILTRKNR